MPEQSAPLPEGFERVEPTPDDGSVSNPLNGVKMEKLRIGPVRIDRCPVTGAIWLDRGELAQLSLLDPRSKAAIVKFDRETPQAVKARRLFRGVLKSPRTGVEMVVVHDRENGVEFEVDPESGGVFLDAGELADLIDYSFRERIAALLG